MPVVTTPAKLAMRPIMNHQATSLWTYSDMSGGRSCRDFSPARSNAAAVCSDSFDDLLSDCADRPCVTSGAIPVRAESLQPYCQDSSQAAYPRSSFVQVLF